MAGATPVRRGVGDSLKLDRALWFSSAFRSFPKGKPGLTRESLGGCTMVAGPHAFRVHFWRCPAMPGVSVFEFVQDNPLIPFCALPYEMQLEPTMNGPGELAGLYTPLLGFSDPQFPSAVIAGSLASTAPHRIVLVGVTAELHAFFRAADPVLSHAAVIAASALPRSAAVSIPALVTPTQPQQPPQQQQDEVVLATQPSTPVLGANSRPVAADYAVLPQFWPSPRRIAGGPLRIPLPSEALPLLPPAQTTMAATTSTSAPDASAMEVERMRAIHRSHRHARHESDGIETLALAARTMDAGTSIDDDLMVDVDDDDGELDTLVPDATAAATTAAEHQLPPRTYVITPGLRTPDLDEEVARVLLESAQRARELLLAASQPPSDAEDSDVDDDGDDDDMAVVAGDDSGDYTEVGARRRHHGHHRDGTPAYRKAKRTFVNRGKIGGGAAVPICRWDGCNKTFGTISELTNHLQSHTATQSVHVCRWDGCARVGKPFGNHSGLFRHLRYHTGDKPCRCNVPGCGFSSVDNGELRRHLHLVHRIELDGNKQ